MKYGVIYKITNKETGMSYIGQTISDISKRFYSHKNDRRSNRYITNVINKYGEDAFIFEEIFACFDQDSLNSMEDFFIQSLNTIVPNGYNLRPGGKQYGKMLESTKKKISNSKKGVPLLKRRGEARSIDYRIKISKGLGGQKIFAVNMNTLEVIEFHTAQSTKEKGFNPSLVVAVCKNKRPHHKGYKFYYENDYANQSGSKEIKES